MYLYGDENQTFKKRLQDGYREGFLIDSRSALRWSTMFIAVVQGSTQCIENRCNATPLCSFRQIVSSNMQYIRYMPGTV